MSLVENIKSLCEMNRISIPKLEKELGFSKGSVYNWDRSSPSIDKIEKVAIFFNVSMNRILYGFDADKFSNLTNIAKGDRTINQFVSDTGIDQNEVVRICLGYSYSRPSIETVKKIAANNKHQVLFTEDDFLEAAGYESERQSSSARNRAFKELDEQYSEHGYYVTYHENYDEVHISRATGSWTDVLPMNEFLEKGFELLDTYESELGNGEIQTIAAHHEGDEWTEEELDTIRKFKEFVKSQRKQ
ncbi:helix-turn-helix domain-containing protein [Paenibacillus alvei]|uniref:helix-turn-helix domain-containing protein n=1 Tax=Paenibacillus alvei TaxID=44250 RepID=UPI001F50C39D|nr:helix-turn-helix transcriptional regulator [Paenibacillus alvei]